MTPTNNLCSQLREYNAWRRGNETLDQPSAAWVGAVIDAAADRLEELERKLAAERALADRLAGCFENVLSDWFENYKSDETPSFYNGERAVAAWKEARRV